ncbi:hypothetical protein BRC98_01205 [Halobacteriales archaeon QS_7_68_65]|nr:MAG: hypothetical protein BRC98_01205 [Halobacteriales archaeon QS_7_68_65]
MERSARNVVGGLREPSECRDDRERADVEQALENTSLAAELHDGNRLVAAARVFTNFVHYAEV